jgi:hypothetical protein
MPTSLSNHDNYDNYEQPLGFQGPPLLKPLVQVECAVQEIVSSTLEFPHDYISLPDASSSDTWTIDTREWAINHIPPFQRIRLTARSWVRRKPQIHHILSQNQGHIYMKKFRWHKLHINSPLYLLKLFSEPGVPSSSGAEFWLHTSSYVSRYQLLFHANPHLLCVHAKLPRTWPIAALLTLASSSPSPLITSAPPSLAWGVIILVALLSRVSTSDEKDPVEPERAPGAIMGSWYQNELPGSPSWCCVSMLLQRWSWNSALQCTPYSSLCRNSFS